MSEQRRKRRLRTLIAVALGVIGFLMLAAVLAFIFFPKDKVRELVVAGLRKNLRREVSVGQTSVSIWGGLGLKLANLRIANPPGFAGPEFASLDKLDVKVKFWPVLRGRIVIGSINLDGLQVALEKNARGESNLAGLVQPQGTPSGQAAAGRSAPFYVEKLRIRNSAVSLRDDSAGTALIAGGIAVDGSMLHGESEQQFRVLARLSVDSVVLGGQGKALRFPQLAAGAELALGVDLKQDLLQIEQAELHVGAIKAAVQGSISGLRAGPELDLNLQSDRFQLAELFKFIPAEFTGFLSDLKSQGEVNLSGTLNGRTAPGQLHLAAKATFANLELSFSKFDGALEIRSGEANLKERAANLLLSDCAFAGEPFSLKAYINDLDQPVVNADLRATIGLSSLSKLSQSLTTLSGRLTLALQATLDPRLPATLSLDGRLSLSDVGLEPGGLTPSLRNLDLEGLFRGKDLVIERLQGEIGRSALDLSGRVTNLLPFAMAQGKAASPPDITLELKADSLDVDELAAPLLAQPADTTFRLPELTARGHLRVAKGNYAQVDFRNLTGRLDYSDNVLQLDSLTLDIYGGHASATVMVDMEDLQHPQFSIDSKAEQIEVNDFLSGFTPLKNVVYGTTEMTSSFSGTAGTPAEALKKLTANGKVTMRNGRLNDFPLVQAVADKLGVKGLGDEIRDLTNSFSIRDGRLGFDEFAMNLGSGRWLAAGSVGLDGTLDYAVSIEVDRAQLAGSGLLEDVQSWLGSGSGTVTIPFKLTGTYAAPQISLDRARVTQAADKKIKEKGKDLLENLLKKKK